MYFSRVELQAGALCCSFVWCLGTRHTSTNLSSRIIFAFGNKAPRKVVPVVFCNDEDEVVLDMLSLDDGDNVDHRVRRERNRRQEAH